MKIYKLINGRSRVRLGNVASMRHEVAHRCHIAKRTALKGVYRHFPFKLLALKKGTFSKCSSLDNIVIPNSVLEIDSDAGTLP